MPVNRHQKARTTPAIRQELRESPLSMAALARRYHLTQATGRQWRRRAETTDRSHRPHHLHPTCTPPAPHLHPTRSPAPAAVVVARRQSWLLPRDDRLAVTRAFLNAGVSRSGLDRCRRRPGVADLQALLPRDASGKPAYPPFKDDAPGVVPVDVTYLPQLPDADPRRDRFAAIDRATRGV